ncbi:enoyl-CoA hydratase/isomerase family protein [Roseinatronobacter alkalisoli]|uniref:3-hydroxyisobutyryl-CoA hydrolase n=1 Tax=Roseinatronobacter alkalisoli TaxID=3028235 RepID=A0ABT5T615_9RHOB|nr:enoyl-CoA hydratase/isomerase family protein [Roseinatronobacter sp. HJB301]MDD7970541.1 enoyl-CoA hydratase/isomerase family protein [Roseinatronobacter sp. HJB301]
MTDVHIRRDGCAGRITLTRASALNALNYEMCLTIDAALIDWAKDDSVALIIMDATGEKAFCAGGDIARIYATGRAGDYAYGRSFWHDEYRMNARLAEYGKPIVSFMQGFVMGGGVGLGCHVSHRVVGESSQIAMPECGIGLIPDVGGTHLLARAPGQLGAYLGLTGARMGAADAIRAGFADMFLPEADWDSAKAALISTGNPDALQPGAESPAAQLLAHQPLIDAAFGQGSVAGIVRALEQDGSDFATRTAKTLRRNSPLSMACTLTMLRNPAARATIRDALAQEYRFTWRSMENSDFLEGIRAAIIDKDRAPRWGHDGIDAVTDSEVAAMLASLGPDELTFATTGKG